MRSFVRSARPRALLAAALLAATPAVPALAADADAFTPAQRAAIVSIVRNALREDPSILRDAVLALRADEERNKQADQVDAVAAHRAALLQGDAIAGNPLGDVTVTEFYDPRCPYCKAMVPVIDAAIASDRKLRVAFKLIPILGPASVLEAKAILAAARQGRYVPMQEALMRDPAPADDAKVARAAKAAGVDPARLAVDMRDPAIARALDANVALARALHADGTPTLVVGSTLVPGAVKQDELAKLVHEARS